MRALRYVERIGFPRFCCPSPVGQLRYRDRHSVEAAGFPCAEARSRRTARKRIACAPGPPFCGVLTTVWASEGLVVGVAFVGARFDGVLRGFRSGLGRGAG
ncbi:hypothetical protein GCM10020221_23460 [Streptomyces thioluteus]|uniref:Uncharacterized protein n=1 Tax=Streptomyces thioluteus TaxID=66431 RepID=A0ABN3WUP5_STRTU